VTEAMNPAREFFGLERLRTALSWVPEEYEPPDLVKKLQDDLAKFAAGSEPADDITLLVVRWSGEAGRA
jgi:serine phosphatase RsbU (regulator of sigma subunit)